MRAKRIDRTVAEPQKNRARDRGERCRQGQHRYRGQSHEHQKLADADRPEPVGEGTGHQAARHARPVNDGAEDADQRRIHADIRRGGRRNHRNPK